MEEFFIYDEKSLQYVKTKLIDKRQNIIFYISLCIVLLFFIIIYSQLIKSSKMSITVNELKNENIQLLATIDEITNKCNYENVIKIKIGEYAMHPHRQDSEITKDSIASLLLELNAWYPEIIMAQIEIESSFGTSELAKRTNNIVGMTKTNSRETTQLKKGNNEKFGVYNNWESCLIDRILWDYNHFGLHKPTKVEYINNLNNFYGGHGDYGSIMNKNSKKFNKYFSAN